ncbi:MAG: Ig-like domain-containing protein [Burkholderiales bacterium]
MTPLATPAPSRLRFAGLLALIAAGFTTLVATGGGGGGSSSSGSSSGTDGSGTTAVAGAACTLGVAPGFTGDVEWASSDGTLGTGADGKGGVAIGVGLSIGATKGARVVVRGPDGAVLGSAATGPDGRATFTSCGVAGPFLVEVSGQAGATYFDESRGAAGEDVPFGEGELLRAYVPALVRNVGVTPYSEAAARALAGAPSAGAAALPAPAAITAANDRVRAALVPLAPEGFVDDPTRMPAVAGAGALLPDSPAGRWALVLGALGRQATMFNPTLAAPALAAARQLALDATDGVVDGFDAAGAPTAAAAARAFEPARLGPATVAALPVVARRHGEPALLARLPAIVGLGAVGLPNPQGVAVATAVRLRSSGVLSTLDASGADARELATEAADLTSASQQPATALFVKGGDGAVRAVGFDGPFGLLGAGTTSGATSPVDVAALRGAGSIGVGLEHAIARMPDGSVVGWGGNARRQLAGTAATRVPQPIVEVRDAISVAAIADLSLAVLQDGTVLSWGSGAGSLGTGATGASSKQLPSPVLAAADTPLRGAIAVAAYVGTSGTPDATLAALHRDGSVWTWGDNATGGLGAAGPSRGFAQPVPGLARIARVVASNNGFFALDRDGAVFFWGQPAAASGSPAGVVAPTRLEGLPPIRDISGAFQGLYQARMLGVDGQRWRADGVNAAQVTEQSELDVRAPAPGVTTIGTIAGDNVINAAERAAGVVVSGTVSQANRPVTVRAGGATRTVTSSGTSWQASFPQAELPASGSVEFSASFTTTAGAISGVATRTVQVDTAGPTAGVTDDQGGTATGPSTFTFTWNEPVTGFTAGDVAVDPPNAARGAFTQVSSTTYRFVVTPPTGAVGTVTVGVPAGAVADLAGNANPATGSGTQPYGDNVPPQLTIERDAATMPSAGANTYPVREGVRHTFRFTWSEPVVGFSAASIEVPVGNKGALNAIAGQPNAYRMDVDMPYDNLATNVTVRRNAVRDTAGNANPADVTLSVPVTGSYVVDLGGAGIGVGGGADGGGASGDGGNPGNPPQPYTVTATVSGGSLRLAWPRHASGVVYYQVIRNSGTPTRTGMVLRPWANPIPAVYSTYQVALPIPTSGTVYYRIRACNTQPPAAGQPPLVQGFTGCRDSGEFIAGGAQSGQATNFCGGVRAQNDVYPDFVIADFPNAPYGLTPAQCATQF